MVIFEPIWLLSKQASFFEAANSEVKIGLSLYNQTTITKFTQVKLALNRDKHCTVVHRLFDIQNALFCNFVIHLFPIGPSNFIILILIANVT